MSSMNRPAPRSNARSSTRRTLRPRNPAVESIAIVLLSHWRLRRASLVRDYRSTARLSWRLRRPPKKANLILRSAASSRRVSKDGRLLGRARGHPSSFENLRTAAQEGGLLMMRSQEALRHYFNFVFRTRIYTGETFDAGCPDQARGQLAGAVHRQWR